MLDEDGKHYVSIQNLCRIYAYKYQYDYDELLSEAMMKVPDYLNSYVPSIYTNVKPMTHVYANLKWYLWKYIKRKRKQRGLFIELTSNSVSLEITNVDVDIIDDEEQVQLLIKQMLGNNISEAEIEWYSYIILMHDIYGYTYSEIGNIVSSPRSTISKWYHQAKEIMIANVNNR